VSTNELENDRVVKLPDVNHKRVYYDKGFALVTTEITLCVNPNFSWTCYVYGRLVNSYLMKNMPSIITDVTCFCKFLLDSLLICTGSENYLDVLQHRIEL